MTENLDSTSEPINDYLRESFTTDDGLVVPPPTREMGPRRLSRYRLDVADFLRALRDGTELPEEPVKYMGTLPQGEAGSDTRKIYERFNELLDEGAFDEAHTTSLKNAIDAETSDETHFIEDDVILTSDDLVDAQAAPVVEPAHADVLASDEEVITAEELAEVKEGTESAEAEESAEATEEEPHRFSHLFADDTAQESAQATSGAPDDSQVSTAAETPLAPAVEVPSTQVEEELVIETDVASETNEPVASGSPEAETVVSEPAENVGEETSPVVETKEKPKETPNRFDLIRAKAAKARSVGTVSAISEPVSAFDSQGLEPLNQAEERAAESRASGAQPVEEQTVAPVAEATNVADILPTADEAVEPESHVDASAENQVVEENVAEEETASEPSLSVAQAVVQKSSRADSESSITPEVIEEAETSTPVDMPEKKSSSATWLIILSLLVIIVLMVIWMMFFK